MSRIAKTRVENIVALISNADRGYSVSVERGNLVVSHPWFTKPISIAVGRGSPDTILMTLERYRSSLAPRKGE
jgi:hypothetical protein